METLKTLEAKQLVLLAALPEQDRLFLMDGSLSVYAYALSHALLEYQVGMPCEQNFVVNSIAELAFLICPKGIIYSQVAVSRGELETAKALLSRVPVEGHDAAARALQAHGWDTL